MIIVLIAIAKTLKLSTENIQEKIVAGLFGTSVTTVAVIGGKKMYNAYIKSISQFYDKRKGYRGDNRRYGAYIVASYVTDYGVEYRRGYWFPVGTSSADAYGAIPKAIEVNDEN